MKRRYLISAALGLAVSPLLFLRKGPTSALESDLPDLLEEEELVDGWPEIDPMQDREGGIPVREIEPLQEIKKSLVTNTDTVSGHQGTPVQAITNASDIVKVNDSVASVEQDEQAADGDVKAADGSDALIESSAPEAEDMDSRDSQTMAVNASNTAQDAAQDPSYEQSQPSVASSSDIDKSIHFAHDYDGDIYVSEDKKVLLLSVFMRLKRLQNTIGFGNFNIVSFDQSLRYARDFEKVGAFTPEELTFIDELFAFNSEGYGFYGDKVTANLTQSISQDQVIKIPYTGHYLFRDQSLAHYEKLKKDVGDSIILTSGIRSNVKQLYLFLAKTVSVEGNLSRASRSLAPPGYSYHGIGDFDVGRVGWGARNFTDDFAQTDEFKKMQDLGYIAIRYNQGNKLGVRFEPWHIKVV